MLSVTNLESGYGEMQVLWGIDLEVKEKSITVVLGPNGAGKSTTLKTIFGTLKPWSGKIEYIGEDITFLPPHKKVELGITFVPEGRHLFPNMTVKDNLYMGAYLKRAEERFEESLELVYSLFPRLKERESQKAGTLSGGEQQMLAIARALMTAPNLILMDEPSQGLAPKLVKEVFETILKLKDEGLTILLVEQNVFASLEISDYAYILHEGRIAFGGTVDEVKESEDVKKAYLGV
ncbi:ABC-type branched-chain amino acid transport system, ATPase component [Archaeoglobus fulgidus DSM 8774]|jgi:branched-chain amino acid transport system ATP-binding protein|uniref:ABC-type branched-chain amino acid transport system, ATPase component n=1 Tax=Archaeoglobus fulgidus DSM 8774 TaxID=1344584 RepID=A0A075WDT6_ARCFL|nr:ABC transporter ATP-binding protein [Archaeoglobus fulgidus]AIG97862.1 ABC-type branched-chain amino acid transport system, ATPase component [Archaeoglobus fulgidus DSM 8774]